MIRDTSRQDVLVEPRQVHKKRIVLILGCLASVGILAAFAMPSVQRWSDAEFSYPRARLRLGEITRGTFIRDAAVQGRIVAATSPTLYSPTTGTVTLAVQAGDPVKKDQVLAEIDSPELGNELERESATLQGLETDLEHARIDSRQKRFEAKRAIDMAKVSLDAAEREMRRAGDPKLRMALSQLEYEKVTDDLSRARIEHKNAQEQNTLQREKLAFEVQSREHQAARQRLVVQNLKRRVNELKLRSPVDGMVGALNAVQKAVVTANAPIVTVVDLSAYAAELEVPESYADDLGLGMNTEISVNGKHYTGTISAVSPEVKSNLVNARVSWEGETPPGLRQNQRISARILFESRDGVLMAPRGAFMESGGGRSVYVVQGNVAEKRRINTGATSVGTVEILEGLKPGEQIILSSSTDFKDAQNILLTE